MRFFPEGKLCCSRIDFKTLNIVDWFEWVWVEVDDDINLNEVGSGMGVCGMGWLNKRIKFGQCIIIFLLDIDTTNNERIWINLVIDFLLPHHSGETSFRVSPLRTHHCCWLNRSYQSYDTTCRLHACCRERSILAVPSGVKPPLQKGLHFSFDDLRRPHEKDDEPLHPSRTPARSTYSLTLVGWVAGPTSRVSYAVCALADCRADSRKSKILLPIHS